MTPRRAVSTAHGALRHVLLWCPLDIKGLRGYRAAYAELFRTLPATVRLTVIVHPKTADLVDELLATAGREATTTVLATGHDRRFTVWAQDPCLVLEGEDGTPTLLTPPRFDREQDIDVVELLAAAGGVGVQRSPLCFQGGDVLVGDDFALVGRSSVNDTLDHLEQGDGELRDTDVTDRFEQTLGCKVVVVDTGGALPEGRMRTISVKGRDVLEILPGGWQNPHPLGHLDMFVTLAGRGPSGRYRLLVGSPVLADELLGRSPLDDALPAQFDDVAAQLADEGFEVHRNPMPLTYGDGRRKVDDRLRDVRVWYYATANNCLLQIDPVEGDRVWLPTYGHEAWRELAATDAANRRLWENLGFAVCELGSFHAFAQRFGALHCIAKELERRQHVSAPATEDATALPVRALR